MEVRGVNEMERLAADFVAGLSRKNQATVVGLIGDLGSGKTTFVQCVAKALGIVEPVTSPTFVIQKMYTLESASFEKLVHIDAYRLERARDLSILGWKETSADPANLIFIEWPENIAEALPEGAQTIHFKYIDENTREINF